MKWEDYGESSLSLLAEIVGIEKENVTIPYDPSDFKRCVHLFECLNYGSGEIFSLLNIMADKYPIWEIYRFEWDNLMKIYNEEKQQESAPKLYKYMKELQSKKSDNIRR